ncbi:leukocyte immunoglobulin-like receptor subfamily A member 5 isoform X2 [Grammomys surdaster]|uniref:leukocyte immunoglobulin-like receptor subfamily A member 5 isoform X2 n=1 Tax=Grammomys surdaster TaxID=491861 RepID=UPI00109FA3AB|nr:leukocyte immunoglobulin-like receptor subfamily A member 5 isoform X2 [Grammomys surdaster]
MIFTSTAMLYLGLILGLRSPVLAGNSYRKPRLSVLDSPTVNTGENMTFQCISWQEYDGFILTKEGEPKFSRTLDSQYIFTGHLQAIFYVGPMTPSHSGTYRCYGFYKRNPQKLSMPSDPLEIHVSGVSETINSSEAKAVSKTQDHTVENIFRMATVGLILLVFGILQLKAWHNQRQI